MAILKTMALAVSVLCKASYRVFRGGKWLLVESLPVLRDASYECARFLHSFSSFMPPLSTLFY